MYKNKKLIAFNDEMIDEINKFKEDNFITTFTGAVIELVRRGLEFTKEKGI